MEERTINYPNILLNFQSDISVEMLSALEAISYSAPVSKPKTMNSHNVLPIDHIKCECGKTCHRSKKFSVYGVDFCSIKCLQKFKTIEDEARKPKETAPLNIRADFGGSPCC